jgi:hypothetical protein
MMMHLSQGINSTNLSNLTFRLLEFFFLAASPIFFFTIFVSQITKNTLQQPHQNSDFGLVNE